MDYICCSAYGRPRSKGFHCKYYKQLLAGSGLPDIRWHDLRSTYCTLLLKEENELLKNELLEIVVDVTGFLPETAQNGRTDVCHFCTFESVCGIVDAERLLSMAAAKCLQAVTWLVAL